VLCGFGDAVRHIYFPNESVIGFLVEMEDGNSAETANVGCEGAAGHVAALGSRRSSSHHLVQVSGTAARIKAPTLAEAFERRPGLRQLLHHYAEALLVQVQQSAACNALHAVTPRLCRWILTMQDRSGGDTIRLTHEFMAQMLGVHRSTVTVVARSLQSAGVIAYRRGVLTVRDRAGLRAESCECYEIVRTEFERLLRRHAPRVLIEEFSGMCLSLSAVVDSF
jgi:CRP-like cAMP-binding protein